MIKDLLSELPQRYFEEGERAVSCYAYASHEGKLLIVVMNQSEGHISGAFECDNTREDVQQVVDVIKPLLEDQSITTALGVAPGRMSLLSHPTRYGYALVYRSDTPLFINHLFSDIKRKIESIRSKIVIMNEKNVLKNALAVWSSIQPSGFSGYLSGDVHSDRHEKSAIDHALYFLRKWDFLLLAEDEEIRELYKKYYKASVCFYSCQMSYDR